VKMDYRLVLSAALAGLVFVACSAARAQDGEILSLLTDTSAARGPLASGATLVDASPAHNDATVHGNPLWLKGAAAALLLSHGAYLEIPASDSFRGQKTLSVAGWFHPSRRPTNWPILFGRWDHPDHRSFFLYANNRGWMEWGVGWSRDEYRILREGCPLPVKTWTHLAATWDGATGELRLYCNGELVKEDRTPAGVSILDSDAPVLIGSHNNTPGGSGSFAGGVSRLRAWDRPLGADEVRRLFGQERGEYAQMALETDRSLIRLDAGSDKQLLLDDGILAEMDGVKITMNRPERRGGPCIVADRPWERALNCFGVTVLQEADLCRMYYNAWDAGTAWEAVELLFCYATSTDGVNWGKPDLDIVPYGEAARTNILYPDAEYRKEPGYFFGTCVFADANPACRPEERYKMINGDSPTCVWSSPDGLRFRRVFAKPSFRPADTNNLAFYDDRIGRYVAYVRSWDPLRAVGRCEFDDLSDFGPDTIVLSCDDDDQETLDKSRFTDVSFYNFSAIKYPYAANAYMAFPSAFYHYPEPPVGRLPNDGVADIQLAVSRDGVEWSRPSRGSFMALQDDEYGLYMATGIVRQGDELSLYYGVYYNTHGDVLNVSDHISRATIRLDGFVSADAAEEGSLVTVPLAFTGSHLELNVVGEEVRAALLDETGQPIPGYGLPECDPISGDHTAATVTWGGKSDLKALAGRLVQLRVELRRAKLYAFQFAA